MSDKESLWGDICNEISALPKLKAKSNSRALTLSTFSLGDSSSDEEDLDTPEEVSHNVIYGQIELFKAGKFLYQMKKQMNITVNYSGSQ